MYWWKWCYRCKNADRRKLNKGNGTGNKDVYKIEEVDDKYVLNYYDAKENSKNLLEIDVEEAETFRIGNFNFGNPEDSNIALFNSNGQKVTFEKIYLILNGEKLDASRYIQTRDGYSYLYSLDLYDVVEETGENFWSYCDFGEHEFIIEKDGKEYSGTAVVSWQLL